MFVSLVKTIKTYLRNTTFKNRLNGLANINIHLQVTVAIKKLYIIEITEDKVLLDFHYMI